MDRVINFGRLRTLAAAFMLHSLVACSPDSRFAMDACITSENFFTHYGAYLTELRDPRTEPRRPPDEVVFVRVSRYHLCPDESVGVLEQQAATYSQRFSAVMSCRDVGFVYRAGGVEGSGGYFRGHPGSHFEGFSLNRGYSRVGDGRVDRISYIAIDAFEDSAIKTYLVFKYSDFKQRVCAGSEQNQQGA